MSSVRDAALSAHEAGLSVIPILADGSKRPPIKWATYQLEQPSDAEIDEWFGPNTTGMAVICGAVSGNLEILDFDDADTYRAFVDTAESLGLGPLVDRVRAGYEESTPSGGVHMLYTCDHISNNTKLARRESREVLIETRGIGGYVVTAPSHGTVHASGGAWTLTSGGFDTIADITPEERASLFTLARSFDQVPPDDHHNGPGATGTPSGGDRPGDDFRARHSALSNFRTIVERHGWRLTHTRGSTGYFRRPGKDEGWSATYNHADSGLFYVFSSSTEFEPERGYNPFSVYAILNHGGDFAAAASALAREGYGESGSIGTITVTSKRPKVALTAFTPADVPEAAIGGWVREYVDLMSPTTEAPDAFHVATALTLVGSIMGRRIALFHASDKLHANFYTLLVGPSGRSRKDTAIKRGLGLAYSRPPRTEPLVVNQVPYKIVRDISSSEGLIAMLQQDANLILYTSEFSKLMSNAARESTRSIGPTLIEAFDTPPSLQNNTKANIQDPEKKGNAEAKDPYVSVLSTVQPEILADLVGKAETYSGFLNRWMIVVGDSKGARPNPPDIDEDTAWRLLNRLTKRINEYDQHTILRFSDAAAERWADWYIRNYPTGNESAAEDAMGIRRGTIVKKISLVYAVTEGAREIDLPHLEYGIAFGDWCWEQTRRMIPSWGESQDAEMERKIIEKLTAKGPMKKRQLQGVVGSRLGPGVFARIIKSMTENGDIVVTSDNLVALSDDV